jgi:hypothetical protein
VGLIVRFWPKAVTHKRPLSATSSPPQSETVDDNASLSHSVLSPISSLGSPMSFATAVLLDSLPQPSTSPEPVVFATDTQLCLRYCTAEEEIAVIHFPLVKKIQFGSPNNEALGGHPLIGFGLKHYRIHRIDNSPWLAELEQRNAIHPRHDKKRFLKDAIHYVFTFQDSTLECIVIEGQIWQPKVQVFTSEQKARDVWRELINDVGA